MDKERLEDKQKAYNDRFVRWQQLTTAQISFTNNLVLGFNLGFLGFFVTQSGLAFSCVCWIFTLQVFALLSLTTSFFTGILLVINRLNDFRKTTQLVKYRKKQFEIEHNLNTSSNIETVKSTIAMLKTEANRLGKITWILLNWQIWTFLIGAILGVVFIAIANNQCG
ncbi:hypothetical protein SAMN04488028_101469 [Reichenbachiella agariperforans]|uniref:Uncharacterized protein n=1 Tax=Reichenbachiella agariperforans TaxID=156994 RepID=A0A1M6K7G7_REIAG|nr:hypothetical protein [Reichenbachiella agariperforans]SHJ54895.1 hypothetical protein SAMN04488028_101469 [Reichenbachiella agariperforans]